ncbi:hypothetical protein HJB56_16030 [Rhizobium lentis]|uniref:protein phosphatase 2C domain-containing protein n=1 Tax=Rhizobium lentis TaxID=1138194 RepID=UPI001C8401FD|nr:protein phosphatase 2C domain-containing protein [Rhizobium lentis]MBX5084254.1 hypothetical protein [Rhizobium lentis]MBX5097529.1 hypothetical protein [Rhizobium lentis]MBX5121752.1 hypothetical protein [Rhizobium lentis]
MLLLHRWTVAKQQSEPKLNEDASAVSRQRRTYVLSDGASESFSSRRWAKVLVAKYLRKPSIDLDWLRQAIASYERAFDREQMSWSAQASYDRGSFATLLALVFDDDHQGVNIVGIGDTLVVLDDGEELCASFPYTEADQFKANPLLLSTISDRNSRLLEDLPTAYWRLDRNPKARVYCMTDAVGAWLLANSEERLPILRSLGSRDEFVDMVETARAMGDMRRDDSTLLVLGWE